MKTMKTLGMVSKKYQLSRKKFVEYYPTVLFGMVSKEKIEDDLIKGSEFVITAEELLEKVEWIDGKLLSDPKEGVVHHSKIELIN